MKRSTMGTRIALGIVMFVLAASSALAAVPTRELSSAVRNWYIYSDGDGSQPIDPSQTNGILDVNDDPFIATFQNRKTTDDNAVALTSASASANTTSFYMNYSGAENQSSIYYLTQSNGIGGYNRAQHERYSDANGHALGWTTQSDAGGFNLMTVSVHNGANTINDGGQTYNANPQVASATGMNNASKDPITGAHYTPKYNEATDAYDEAVNYWRHTYQEAAWVAQDKNTENDSYRGLKLFDREGQAYDGALNPATGVYSALYEQAGTTVGDYGYQDTFVNEGQGGVINGLAGTEFESSDPDRVENQQVIRIDFEDFNMTFAEATSEGFLLEEQWMGAYDAADLVNAVDELVFYDYGAAGDAEMIALLLNVDRSRTMAEGQIYLDNNDNDIFDAGDYAFADNRVFIAELDQVPEPATMSLLALGGLGMLRRRKARKNA
ncbi:MAG: PEP-CTERM sorting domain-containing protein [Phycisphaerales bacterium]|nr:PEP-CTERM sorting domain-containing protein [Phycisphaerales bacterium]MBT7171965.1 PEP-CTERM sorting domain-containing protein [Phycisphaerales bacterium]